MDNKTYLENIKHLYSSLEKFSIQDDYLILNTTKTFRMPIHNIQLATLNSNLFLLIPEEIFQIIYMLELLYKDDLREAEISFITSYTNKYINLDNINKSDNTVDQNRLWCLGFPINYAYTEQFKNTSAGKLITSILDTNIKEVANGKNKQPALVLKKGENPTFELEKNEDNFTYLKEAGFTTFFLIIGAVVATSLYMLYFFITN